MAEEESSAVMSEQMRAFALAGARRNDASAAEATTPAAQSSGTRVEKLEAGLMITFAAICDLFGAIPLIGSFVGGFAWGVIGLWAWWKDLKRPPNALLMNAAKLIPLIGLAPANILSVVWIIKHHNRTVTEPAS